MQLGANGEAYIAGTKYPFQAGYQKPWSEFVLPALGAVASAGCTLVTGGVATVACLAIPVALPFVYDWITKSGGRFNPQTGQLERYNDGLGIWDVSTPATSCRGSDPLAVGLCALNKLIGNGWPANTVFSDCYYYSQAPTQVGVRCKPYPSNGSSDPLVQVIKYGTMPPSWLPSSMDDIAPYMRNVNPDPRVWGELINKGTTLDLPNPTITGPTSIQGPETVKQNSDGTKEISRTTYNFTINGNTITNTSNVTTTNNYNSSNVQTGTTTSTTTPTDTMPQEEPKDPCDKHPTALGCKDVDFDTPDGEIPKETKQITFAPESVLGGGSCPAPRPLAFGRDFSYAATCDALTTYVRPVVIAIAGWIAIVIIFGVGKPE